MKDYTFLILLAVSGSGIKRAFVIENLKKYYVKNLSSNWEKTSSWE
jgi:hypothetical protein